MRWMLPLRENNPCQQLYPLSSCFLEKGKNQSLPAHTWKGSAAGYTDTDQVCPVTPVTSTNKLPFAYHCVFGFQLHQQKADCKLFIVIELFQIHSGGPALRSTTILHLGGELRKQGVPKGHDVSSRAFLGSAQNLASTEVEVGWCRDLVLPTCDGVTIPQAASSKAQHQPASQ